MKKTILSIYRFQQSDAFKELDSSSTSELHFHQQPEEDEVISNHNAVNEKFLGYVESENARLHLFDDHGT